MTPELTGAPATPGPTGALATPEPTRLASPGSTLTTWSLVAIGDSVVSAGVETSDAYPDLFARQIPALGGVSSEYATAETTAEALTGLGEGGAIRALVAGADIVMLTVGANDANFDAVLPPGVCGPGGDGSECLAVFNPNLAQNLEAILVAIHAIRGAGPTAIFMTSPDYNPFIGWAGAPTPTFGLDVYRQVAAAEADVACAAAERHGDKCINLMQIFNGPNGTDDAKAFLDGDHLHPNLAGRSAIADALLALGLDPLTP